MATIKVDFGEGGANLTPTGSAGEPTLAEALRDVADDLGDAIGTDPGSMTAPTAGNGSGADGTTFSGAQCDQLRADVAAINAILATMSAVTLKTIKG